MIQDINDIDNAIILEYTNYSDPYHKENTIHDDWYPFTMRPLAPFGLNDVFKERNIPSTVVNYADWFTVDQLVYCITTWLEKNNLSKPIICFSSLSQIDILDTNNVIQKVLTILLDKDIEFMFIAGGPSHQYPNSNEKNSIYPNYIFCGRALHILEQWLDNKIDIEDHIMPIGNFKRLSPKTADVKEEPIVPKLYDDYCLTKHDVIQMELRIGCKFNCTFCSFEYRGAKKVTTSKAHQVYEYMQTAKDKYGITNFSIQDDTVNEDEEKLMVLKDATELLDYRPNVGGFIRFDLLMRKKHVLPLLDSCGFQNAWFGLESFHEEANKVVRKRIKREDIFNFLRHIRKEYPHWRFNASVIVGLPKEPLEHIKETMKTVTRENLLDGVDFYPLMIEKGSSHVMSEHASEFSRYPEKFGIKFLKNNIDYNHNTQHTSLFWSHEHANVKTAKQMCRRMHTYNAHRGIHTFSGWDHIVAKALNFDLDSVNKLTDDQEFFQARLKYTQAQIDHIFDYIGRKINYYKNL
jgi:lipoate synthase